MTRPLAATILILALCAALACPGESARPAESAADLQFNYAQGLYRDRLRKLAVAELEKFIAAHGGDPRISKAHYYIGECRWYFKDYKGALAPFEVAARDPKLADRPIALFRVGDCRYRLGDRRGAAEPLRQFLALKLADPRHARFAVHARYTLARADVELGSFAEALPLLQQILADPSPENTYKSYVLLLLGNCLSALNKPAEALKHYRLLEKHLEGAIGAKPPKAEAASLATMLHHLRVKIGTVLIAQRKFKEAVAAFARLDDKGPRAEEVLYGRAQSHFYLQQYPKALVPSLGYLKRFPAGKLAVNVLYIAAESTYRTGRLAEAEGYFAQFLAADKGGKHPARETAAYGRVAAAYSQGQKHAAAIAAAAGGFLEAFAASKHAPAVRYFAAEAAFWLGKYPEALADYRKVADKAPYAEDAAHQVAVCLDLLKRPQEAAAAYDAWLARYPKGKHHQQALERAARLWALAKNHAKAAERYGAFVARYAAAAPKVAEEFLYRKGAAEYEAKQYDAMYKTFKAYFERYRGGAHKSNVLYFLAWYHGEHEKQYEAAVPFYELCAAIPGRYQLQARYLLAHAHSHIGQGRLAAGKTAEADEHFAKGAESFLLLMRTAPDRLAGADEYLWTAETFRKVGRKAEAIEAYERLLKRHPKQAGPLTYYWLGEMSRTLEPPKHEQAVRYLKTFHDANPRHEYILWAKLGLAESLKALGGAKNHELARPYYKQFIELAPRKIKDTERSREYVFLCKLQMGRMAFDDKRYQEAIDYLRRLGYLALGDEAAEALYKAGLSALRLKDPDAAVGIWGRLLRNHPASPWAARLKKELPELGFRLALAGKAVERAPAKP